MKKTEIICIAIAALALSCKNNTSSPVSENDKNNTSIIAKNDSQKDWKILFDGKNLEHWEAYQRDSISNQWKIEDNTLILTPETSRNTTENLISKQEFTNFELSLDWKISEAGNSGIMWGVQEKEGLDEPYYTGPEIQLLDNEMHPDAKNGTTHRAGSLYDMVAPSTDLTKPAGQWNSLVIHINHKNNEGWVLLNGKKVTEFPVEGDKWNKMVSKSKFKNWDQFGKYPTGHIALQDHGNQVSFKNIKIKEL